MYPSDYGLSVGIEYIFKAINQNAEIYVNNAWLYDGGYREWLISPESDRSTGTDVFASALVGNTVNALHVPYYGYIFFVRPTFYLKADVLYSKGDGSSSNPYYISL